MKFILFDIKITFAANLAQPPMPMARAAGLIVSGNKKMIKNIQISIVLLITLIINNKAISQNENINEIKIVNSLLFDLYNIGYCEKVINLPYYACNDYSTENDTFVDNCNTIPTEYKIYCKTCINRTDLNSMDLVMHVDDTLRNLDLSEVEKYLLKKVGKKSQFKKIITKSKNINQKSFCIDSLKQEKLKILITGINKNKEYNYADFKYDTLINPKIHFINKRLLSEKYGKNNNTYIIGYLSFSRIIFNKKHDLGIFKYTFFSGYNCGYISFVLIKFENNNWIIDDIIDIGAF